MILLSVSHRNQLSYAQSVSISRNLLHLTPRTTAHQTCHRSAIAITPEPQVRVKKTDFFGNPIELVTIQQPHDELIISSSSLVEVTPPNLPDAWTTMPWEQVRDGLQMDRSLDGLGAYEFSFDSLYTLTDSPLEAYVLESFTPGRPVLEAALDLMGRIFTDFTFDAEATELNTPIDEVFEIRRGVCQDFTHLMIAMLRRMGLGARYVSGYLLTYPPAGKEKLIGADASHAWLSLWVPGLGWVDLDPTNNKIPTDEHITVAWGRDYSDVSPIRGVLVGGSGQSVEVAVDVSRVQPDSWPEAETAANCYPHPY